MRKWLAPAMTGLALAIIAHIAVLHYAPRMIMDRAMERLSERGTALHAFSRSLRTTPQTQTVVRPSPDLAYSICLFDMRQAPQGLRVRMAPYANYASLSFFDAETNNFLTLRGDGEAREVLLLPPQDGAAAAGTAIAPTERGIILVRRLAPSAEEFAAAAEVSEGDDCEPVRN
ncbi:DUF1254 domain-containing protein [Altererythrobacter litoralis]|uniref:DUF1254 domain-containing protein n=1 Tax=Altererythrobacter litoralis TaxID=3113904 RepID=A0ABU7GEQ6_9SPHN|nr:DUF1254 domain-containing protein [Erythrobacteraceae bacterium 1XM1-14]